MVDETDLPEDAKAAFDDLRREISRYFVGLGFIAHFERGKMPKVFFRSGFVAEIGGRWWWVTAGHVIKAINEAVAAGVVEGVRLLDQFDGPYKVGEIPFDYVGARKYYQDDGDRGIDFGVVELAPDYVTLLKANGIRAADRKTWNIVRFGHYESPFWMYGFPTDGQPAQVNGVGTVSAKPVPGVISVHRPPTRLKDVVKAQYPRLRGIVSDDAGEIDGMSGGPIFGMRIDSRGVLQTRILAIQSGVLGRRVFGFPMGIAGQLLEAELARDR